MSIHDDLLELHEFISKEPPHYQILPFLGRIIDKYPDQGDDAPDETPAEATVTAAHGTVTAAEAAVKADQAAEE